MALVRLELRLTRSSCADAASETAHFLVPDCQSRQIVLILRKLHLKLALTRFGALRKNIKDQRAAIKHLHARQLLQCADLRRRERIVENRHVRAGFLYQRTDFLRLTLTDEAVRIGRVAVLQDLACAFAACRLQKRLQLIERLGRGGLFLCKKVCVEAHEDGLFAQHLFVCFHQTSKLRHISQK